MTFRHGKTQRMLERAVASDASDVVVVAHSAHFARELMRRVLEMTPAKAIRPLVLEREDGRTIRFLSGHPEDVEIQLKGVRADVFRDHFRPFG